MRTKILMAVVGSGGLIGVVESDINLVGALVIAVTTLAATVVFLFSKLLEAHQKEVTAYQTVAPLADKLMDMCEVIGKKEKLS